MCNWVTMLYSRKKNCIGEITIKKKKKERPRLRMPPTSTHTHILLSRLLKPSGQKEAAFKEFGFVGQACI